ncbi:MAG: hypothetical protein JW863_14290 [Chitinispirillaceae bacterium]|nr:hypothetical protein [Chitinispirillaceae bacterium]
MSPIPCHPEHFDKLLGDTCRRDDYSTNTEHADSNNPAIFTIPTDGPFPEKGPAKAIFHDSGALKVQSIMLAAGQRIPPCAMEHDVPFYIVKGNATLIVDGSVSLIPRFIAYPLCGVLAKSGIPAGVLAVLLPR